jgi:hypothetical protein
MGIPTRFGHDLERVIPYLSKELCWKKIAAREQLEKSSFPRRAWEREVKMVQRNITSF